MIKSIQEIFLDFIPVQPELFSLELSNPDRRISLTLGYLDLADRDFRTEDRVFMKSIESGIFSVLLAYRSIPTIWYPPNSTVCKKIGEMLSSRLEREATQNYSDFENNSTQVILIDRGYDPITPLVINWSYYALVDELLRIEDGSVLLPGTEQPIIFQRESGDEFLDANWNKNFGEVSKELFSILEQEIRKKQQGKYKNATLEEMKEIMLNLPEAKKIFSDLMKHSEIIKSLTEIIQGRSLFKVSELQQLITTEDNISEHFNQLLELLSDNKILDDEKLKLCILFSLKNKKDNDRINGLKNVMKKKKLDFGVLDRFIGYFSGKEIESNDLFEKGSSIFLKATKTVINSFKEDALLFERYKPSLIELVDSVLKRRGKCSQFTELNPVNYLSDELSGKQAHLKGMIVFVTGGVTYDEARELQLYANDKSIKVLLGGTQIIRGTSFLKEVVCSPKEENEIDHSDEHDVLI